MKLYRYTPYVLLLMLVAFMILPLALTTASAESTGYESILKRMGIDVPKNSLVGSVKTYTLSIGRVELQPVGKGFANIVVESSSPSHMQYITAPGKPMIPFITYSFIVKGYVDKAVVSVKPLGVRELGLDKKVLPAPKPVAYSPDYPNKIVYEPDENVYGKDSFYPGTLAKVKVYHGLLGKSIIVVQIYPVQYNPAEDKLIIVDNLRVNVYYPQPTPLQFPQASLLVITTPKLVGLVNSTLGNFYRSRGFNVTVVDTEYIYTHYSPARNITEYPGFYNVTHPDDVYMLLVSKYNHTLARKIITFINETYGNFSHILLVGNAVDVPPSFYFQYSTYLYYWLDPYNVWIPTDLFYADLDRDLVPDLFVGRIPFSNETYVNYTIHKIIDWYNTSAAMGNTLFLAGGYPFAFAEMFGETAMSTMVLFNETWTFNTNILTRTSGTYSSHSVKAILQGNLSATWFYLISHGTGDAFEDRIATPQGMEWETIATSRDILNMTPNPSVPVVSSVACMNGAWDTKLVTPTWFTPPSVGEAILLSPAGGIAYLGSARIAWELIGPFVYYRGIEYNYFYGASLLHREILAAYNMHRLMGIPATLGQVVAEGLANYLADTSWIGVYGPEYYEIIVSEIMKLSLLGDPALELPVPTGVIEKPWISYVYGYEAVSYVDADLVFPGDIGSIPFFKPLMPVHIGIFGGGTSVVGVYETRVYSVGYDLLYHVLVGFNTTMMQNGTGVYETVFDEYKSGKVLIKFSIPGWGELRYQTLAAGVVVTPDRIVIGGSISVAGYGFDAFNVEKVDIMVAGRTLASTLVNPVTGYFNWSLATPYMAPGVYQVTALAPEIPLEIISLLGSTIVVYSDEALNVIISAPTLAEVGDNVSVFIATLYKGQPVNAVPLVKVVDPEGNEVTVTPTPVATGIYSVALNITKTGLYRLEVIASYITPTTESYGYESASIAAVDKLYTIGASFSQTIQLIKMVNATLNSGVTDIINRIMVLNNRTVVIDTKLGEIKGTLAKINDNVLAVNTTAGLILVKLDKLNTTLKNAIENAVASAKQDILSKLDARAQELKTAINKTSQDVLSVGKKTDELSSKVDRLTTIVEAMVAVAYVLIIGAGIAAARRS